jgi:hypothetical protein
MERTAQFSRCGQYRYRLGRRWGDGPAILWIMLNPSTADAERDDPTIRRCIGFSRAWGFGAMEVVNLFALRTPDTAALRAHTAPIGPRNDRVIRAAAPAARPRIAAWGALPWAASRANEVRTLLGGRWLCLSQTASGAPRHPLYAAASLRTVPFATYVKRPSCPAEALRRASLDPRSLSC